MPTVGPRKFSLLDAMILVAAAAVMLWILRVRFDAEERPASVRTPEDYVIAANWFEGLLPCASAWTMAVLVLRLRPPRPSLHRLYRQPGFTACLVASLVVLIGVPVRAIGTLGVSWLLEFGDPLVGIRDWEYTLGTLGGLPPGISLAVASVWVAQWVCGYWRPEPDWIDRSGRAVGWFWIAESLVHELASVGCLGG